MLGLLLAAVAVPEEDVVYYQEVDFVLSRDRIVTIRKTPGERPPFDPSQISNVCDAIEHEQSPGMIAYYLVDDVAERYIDLLDALDEEIDELEEGIDTWTAEKIRRRIAELRHDLLHIRKTLAPTRDAVREVVDGRVDIEGRTLFTREVFPREVEQQFGTTYDKLLRAAEGVDYARDLLAAARDYQQARVSIDQNEVVKRLTSIASILLVPTFIVGLYGQNFIHMPEYRWHYGLRLVVVPDPGDDDRAGRVLPPQALALAPPSNDVPHRQAAEGQRDQRQHRVAGVLEDPDRDVAREVREDPDRDRPQDPPERVPGEEARPGHVVRAREPGCGHAKERQPTPEQHRLAAVARKERLAALEERLPPILEPARPREEAACAVASELVADVVPDDRRGSRDGDHEREPELAL